MNDRRPPRPRATEREFAVLGDLAEVEEVGLHQVLTWPSRDALRQQLLAQMPMTSKQVVLGEMPGAPLSVGAYLPVGAEEAWLVRLGYDVPVPPLAPGTRLTFLTARFEGAGNVKVWWLRPEPSGRAQIERTKMGLTLQVLA